VGFKEAERFLGAIAKPVIATRISQDDPGWVYMYIYRALLGYTRTYMHIYAHIHTYTHIHIHTCTYMHIHGSTLMHIDTHRCTKVHQV
jgi:hypothetical protein